MLGENLIIGEEFRKVASQLNSLILKEVNGVLVVTIAGESGSGKSGIAAALEEKLNHSKVKTLIIQQDDYFLLPPKTNEGKRRKDISWVGVKEVNLELLQYHIDMIREGKDFIKPLVLFDEDKIVEEKVSVSGVKVVIVEGTYTSLLENVDKKIFIDRIYTETKKERMIKAREIQDEFLEKVLEIEHRIISEHKSKADVVITNSFKIIEISRNCITPY